MGSSIEPNGLIEEACVEQREFGLQPVAGAALQE